MRRAVALERSLDKLRLIRLNYESEIAMRLRIASLLVVALYLGASQVVVAADMPAKAPVYTEAAPTMVQNWTGFYVGANVGYAWGHSDAVTSAACGTFVPFYFACGNQALVQASGTGPLSPKGVTGGIQAGYNWQAGHLLYGAELDFGAFSLKDSRAGTSAYLVAAPGVPFTTSSSVETDWLFTARGRLGWIATPGMLIYATGGLALTEIKVANAFNDSVANPGSGAGSNSVTKVGWTLGGGAEWMLVSHWTVKAEYLYVDFGNVSASLAVTCAICGGASSQLITSSDLTAHIARLGLNYRF